MKTFFACLLICLCACQSSTSSAQSLSFGLSESAKDIDSSLVTVSSVYQDRSDSNQKVEIHGTGFLVQREQQLFVITAAHVTQGENLKLSSQDQTLKIKGRLYNGQSDVEVIEVEPGLKTSLQVQGNYIVWKSQVLPRAKWIDRLNFVPLNSWVNDPNLDQDNRFQKTRDSEIYCNLFCYTLHAETLMQPGSSGSPLIARMPNSNEWTSSSLTPFDIREGGINLPAETFFVRGLVIRRERFFSRSAFVVYNQISTLLASYLKGERTDLSKAKSQWYLNAGLLVRGSDHYLESGAVAGSSGNGVSMDGGDLDKIDEENPKQLFDHVKAFPVSNEVLASRETTSWVMMMRHPITSAMISFPAWFDIQEEVQLRGFVMGLTSEDPTNVLGEFFGRFGQKGMPPTLAASKGQGQILKGNKQITLDLNLPDGDHLKFNVIREGYVCQSTCTQRFDPITEVVSDRGASYLIDLRALIFVDHSLSRTNLFRDATVKGWSDKVYYQKFFDEMIDDACVIRLSLRKKRAGSAQPMTVEEGLPFQYQWQIQ